MNGSARNNLGQWLSPLGALYAQIMRIRNFGYDRQWPGLKTRWLDMPVISVGNLTVGGTGKTPTVILIAELVRAAGKQPGIIMRGYGKIAGREADEVLLLKRALGNLPVIANPDRIAGGLSAIDQGAQVLIADDAFQHRRLGRDMDICLIDAGFPFGGGRVLPAGRLREPITGLARADIVIITRSDRVSPRTVETIEAQIRKITSVPILHARHQVSGMVNLLNNPIKPNQTSRVVAFSGIGRNESFFETVRQQGLAIVETRGFPDHHYFTPDEIREIADTVGRCKADLAVCTAKDLVRIDSDAARKAGLDPEKIVALEIVIGLADGHEDILNRKIEEIINFQLPLGKERERNNHV